MEYRAFGKTGIQISALGFGCWEIGGGYSSVEEAEFIKAVNRALDVGVKGTVAKLIVTFCYVQPVVFFTFGHFNM